MKRPHAAVVIGFAGGVLAVAVAAGVTDSRWGSVEVVQSTEVQVFPALTDYARVTGQLQLERVNLSVELAEIVAMESARVVSWESIDFDTQDPRRGIEPPTAAEPD